MINFYRSFLLCKDDTVTVGAKENYWSQLLISYFYGFMRQKSDRCYNSTNEVISIMLAATKTSSNGYVLRLELKLGDVKTIVWNSG